MSLRTRLEALRLRLAHAAQAVIDEWQQDDEGVDEEFGSGGACDAVAQAMAGVLGDIETMEGGHEGDDHAYLIAYDDNEAYVVDIPPGVYERGGGYSWRKIPNVQITEGDIVIDPINRRDIDPEMRENNAIAPNASLKLEPGQHLETRYVLAGAYRGRDINERALLTHAIIVQGEPPGDEVRVLCSQPLDHIADYYSSTPEEAALPPTCATCLKRWERLQLHPNPRAGASRDSSGRYDHDNMNLMCVCGHTLGMHGMGEGKRGSKRVCQYGSCLELGEPDEPCTCENFKKARIQPNPRKRGPAMQLGASSDAANREREASGGRFSRSPPCDFCGKSCAAEHFTDDRATGGSDGPGFYLCGRVTCIRARDRLESEEGFGALKQRYAEQRAKNDGQRPNGRHSRHPTVVQYAVHELFKRKSPKTAAENTARKLNGGTNMFIDVSSDTDIDPKELEEALWINMAEYAAQGRCKPGEERGCAQGALMHFGQWQWGKPPKTKMEDKIILYMSRLQHTPNGSDYYVWVLNHDDTPKDEGPYGPKDLESAKTFARIAATNGAHDRAVSRGIDPQSPSFEIVRRYEHGTGERLQ